MSKAALSILSKLPLAVKPAKPNLSKALHRRGKLLERLNEQREMARCMIDGEQFTATKEKWVVDGETQARTKVTLPKQVRQWYYTINNKTYFEVRYGNKALELAKGKAAIEVGDINGLLNIIDTVIEAVNAGELDELLLAIKRVGAK